MDELGLIGRREGDREEVGRERRKERRSILVVITGQAMEVRCILNITIFINKASFANAPENHCKCG